MTQPISADEATQVLSPHLDSIGSCIDRGWKRWRALLARDAELGVIISNRSRASLVYDFIRYEALNTFDGDPEVTVSDSRGFLLLTFSDKIVMRFKKFRDGSLRTSGIPTQQSVEYANQVLPGMDELTHLVAGYLPDDTGIGLRLAAITCTLDKDQLWVLELDLGIDQVAAPVTPIPVASTQDQVDTIVRPKPAAEDTGQTASEER
ncbi:hypothetical protein C1I97_24050 [Streptomyces sp. NTH33]|uniref:hypothetical protein n=1 Tax=Streptomyces sp. NTH33 TaxID=1735453 RepID=UPI000DA8BE3C|nr:hypothetical protein [Streptomyces sp. NTH33]PZG99772.1 hypothetical protein C1I97_24050 [Streptomyces sp. NTH33]